MKKNRIIQVSIALLVLVSQYLIAQVPNFNAKGIIILSDADMTASTLSDGLIQKDKAAKDQVGIIKLPLSATFNDEIKFLPASNSLLGMSKILAVSKNAKFAYIAETRGAIAENIDTLKNLQTDITAGSYLTALDLSDITQPKLLFKVPVGKNPLALSISNDNQYLAVCTEEYGKELQIIELDANGKPVRVIGKPAGIASGKISDVTWHPSGNFLAYTAEDARQVGLLKMIKDGPTQQIIRVENSGSAIRVGNFPSTAQFTPDGKFYLVFDLKKGSDATNEAGYDGKAEVFVMKMNYEGTGEHFLLSRAKAGENAQSMTLSPDGKTILVVNTLKSGLAWSDKNFNNRSSISILSLSDDGTITNKGEYNFEGIFSKSIAFDATGENIVASVFEYQSYGKHFGGLEFWRFNSGINPSLTKQNTKFFLPKGVHALQIIK